MHSKSSHHRYSCAEPDRYKKSAQVHDPSTLSPRPMSCQFSHQARGYHHQTILSHTLPPVTSVLISNPLTARRTTIRRTSTEIQHQIITLARILAQPPTTHILAIELTEQTLPLLHRRT
jgi:hypothetical protein